MPDPQSFLDNLANLGLVMSVALEHIQSHREPFLKIASGQQVRRVERSINNIRSLAEQLENEFRILDNLVAQHRRLM
jgi:hypothetical protein